MAFKREQLSCYANNARTGVVPALWLYYNADADNMTTAGLIKDNRLAVNDIVTVVGADHTVTQYYVSAAVKGDVTLTAVG